MRAEGGSDRMSPSLAVLKVDPSFIFPLSLSQSLICALPQESSSYLSIRRRHHFLLLLLLNMVRNSVLLTQTRVVNDARGENGEGGVDGKLSQKGAACHPCRGPQSVENYCNGLWAEQDAHGPWSRFFWVATIWDRGRESSCVKIKGWRR